MSFVWSQVTPGQPITWTFPKSRSAELHLDIRKLYKWDRMGAPMARPIDYSVEMALGAKPFITIERRQMSGKIGDPSNHVPAGYHVVTSIPDASANIRIRLTIKDDPVGVCEVLALLRMEDDQGAFFQVMRDDDSTQVELEFDETVPCGLGYRVYDRAQQKFVYPGTQEACPYAGDECFDKYDISVRQVNDECGKTLESCRKRFPSGLLPFRPKVKNLI